MKIYSKHAMQVALSEIKINSLKHQHQPNDGDGVTVIWTMTFMQMQFKNT